MLLLANGQCVEQLLSHARVANRSKYLWLLAVVETVQQLGSKTNVTVIGKLFQIISRLVGFQRAKPVLGLGNTCIRSGFCRRPGFAISLG